MPICKLCGNEKILIKKTHIIPEFFYTELYDDQHRMILFDVHERAKGNLGVSKPPKGEYEGGLLCKTCDGDILGSYESYIGEIFNDARNRNTLNIVCHEIKNEHGMEFWRLEELDYQKTKLCLLSILWRASISKRNTFNEVRLSPYESKLKKQLFTQDPSTDLDIQIVVLSWKNDPNTATDVIGQPRKHRKGAETYYSFVLSGFVVMFYVSKNSIEDFLKPFRLQEDNTLTIIHLPKGTGMNFLINYTGAADVLKKRM